MDFRNCKHGASFRIANEGSECLQQVGKILKIPGTAVVSSASGSRFSANISQNISSNRLNYIILKSAGLRTEAFLWVLEENTTARQFYES